MRSQRLEVSSGGERAAGDKDTLNSGVVWMKYVFRLHDVSVLLCWSVRSAGGGVNHLTWC